MIALDLARRPASVDDLPFLRQLYGSTRSAEFASLGWSDAQLTAFLDMQFEAQHAHYCNHYPGADFLILTLAERPVGRLSVDRAPDEIVLIDIALLPEYRGAGLGTALLRGLIDEAARAGTPLRLHVDKQSRALRLYRRLGFATIGEHGLSWHMEWREGADGQGREKRLPPAA